MQFCTFKTENTIGEFTFVFPEVFSDLNLLLLAFWSYLIEDYFLNLPFTLLIYCRKHHWFQNEYNKLCYDTHHFTCPITILRNIAWVYSFTTYCTSRDKLKKINRLTTFEDGHFTVKARVKTEIFMLLNKDKDTN